MAAITVYGVAFVSLTVLLSGQIAADRVKSKVAELEALSTRMEQVQDWDYKGPQDYVGALLQLETDIEKGKRLFTEVTADLQTINAGQGVSLEERQAMQNLINLMAKAVSLKESEITVAHEIQNASADQQEYLFKSKLLPLLKREDELRGQAVEFMQRNVTEIEFVQIFPGQFEMGCSPGDSECSDDEKPRHHVRISKEFEIGKYPVTQAMWESVMDKNPSLHKGADRPVEEVTWNDAQEFLRRVNAKNDGYRYRLPTEAEWEYAARAGSASVRYGGMNIVGGYTRNSEDHMHPVGQQQPNAWGLYDMLENVYEWVQDWYGDSYFQRSPSKDPRGPSSGEFRVLRGGFLTDRPSRVSQRFYFGPDVPYYSGFRCVREATR
jgi:formylglycine-generating enzyme required for sulfatase activity